MLTTGMLTTVRTSQTSRGTIPDAACRDTSWVSPCVSKSRLGRFDTFFDLSRRYRRILTFNVAGPG